MSNFCLVSSETNGRSIFCDATTMPYTNLYSSFATLGKRRVLFMKSATLTSGKAIPYSNTKLMQYNRRNMITIGSLLIPFLIKLPKQISAPVCDFTVLNPSWIVKYKFLIHV